jgi:hypothetical protein
VTVLPVKLPGFHVYVDAPLAVKTDCSPSHIFVALADAVIVGVGFVASASVAVPLQVPSEAVRV